MACLSADEIGKSPTAFETEGNGGAARGSVSIRKTRPDQAPKKITYIAVCDVRDWKNKEGQVIRACMLAFERNPADPETKPLTLVSEGKVRLLLEGRKQFNLYPLSNLSEEDQNFVDGLIRARKAAAEAAAEKTAPEKEE
ncbi:hypothetical protein HAHE_09400 [Haloferula helveola]|uniref:Uncharacterized protein n=2 Tax=Haloferula helveola TaxID=490095 RepID=A0ABN6H326_9BACT|nr:hypothetical protein HAHE_09400 [Haloferula helveola]